MSSDKGLVLKNKIPTLYQICSVYAIIVILVYGWTIYWSLWKLPSWLNFLSVGEIAAIFCYFIMTNFFESLLVLLGVILVSLLFPRTWFRDVFVSRGSMLVAIPLISIMVFETYFVDPAAYLNEFPLYVPFILIGAVIGAYFAGRIDKIRKSIEVLADNATIFLYISLPVSLLSLMVVIARNLFQG